MKTHFINEQRPVGVMIGNDTWCKVTVSDTCNLMKKSRYRNRIYRLCFFIFCCILYFPKQMRAQYYTPQNNVWTFGYSEGVNFNSGTPVSFTSGAGSYEGSAAMCDGSGQLLFYTEGSDIYDKTGVPMPNGIAIVPFITLSTTQAASIVPVINNPDQYYVFSLESYLPGVSTLGRLSFCIVDMTLNGGLGDVVPGTRNTVLGSGLSEKMITVAGNNCDIWLLTHDKDLPHFLAYNISAAGVNTVPVVSAATGEFALGTNAYKIGTIKVSPDRTMIANCVMNGGYGGSYDALELLNFDPATGIVNGCRVLNYLGDQYDADFSPDNTRLYSYTLGSTLYQYDLTLTGTAAISASQFTVFVSTDWGGQMKLGPDGRMYCQTNAGFLNCIRNPNLLGAACNFHNHDVFVGSNGIGMPNMNVMGSGIFSGNKELCIGSTVSLSNAFLGGTWSSSDITIATVNTTGLVTGISAGTAAITYIPPGTCPAITTVTVNSLPVISSSTDICIGATTAFTATPAGGIWSSSNAGIASIGSNTGLVTGISAGTVVITYKISGAGCYSTVIANVGLLSSIMGSPICIGGTSAFTASSSGGTWSSSNPGIASINSTTGLVNGISVGTAIITYRISTTCYGTAIASVSPLPAVTIAPICVASSVLFNATPSGGTWSSGNIMIATVDGTGLVTGVSTGTVAITYTSLAGCTAVVIGNVNPAPLPITGITELCAGSTVSLSDATAGGTWSSSNPSIATVPLASGFVNGISGGAAIITYQLSGSGCYATTMVTVDPIPAISGAANICLGSSILFSSSVSGGTWSSLNPSIATVDAFGNVAGVSVGAAIIQYITPAGCIGNTPVSVYPVPAPYFGYNPSPAPVICAGAVTYITGFPGSLGGASVSWTSSDPSVATVTMTSLTSSSSTAVITGISPGTAVISYSVTNGWCTGVATFTITVLPTPALSGPLSICMGTPNTLVPTIGGGSWFSYNPSVATVDPFGNVTGVTTGTAIIDYSLSTGCAAFVTVTVNPTPAPVFTQAKTRLCVGDVTFEYVDPGIPLSTVLSYSWVSSNSAVATVTGTATIGTVTAIAPGTATITYSVTNIYGCTASVYLSITVFPTPPPITGSNIICIGSVTPLHNTLAGGSWSSSDPIIATVDAAGNVTGISGGTVTISYTTEAHCAATMVVTIIDACIDIVSFSNIIVTGTPGATVTITGYDAGGATTFSTSSVPVGTNIASFFSFGTMTMKLCVTLVTYSGINCPGGCCIHREPSGFYYGRQSAPTTMTSAAETNDGKLIIIPNPNKGIFIVKGSLPQMAVAGEAAIEVVDMLGRTVFNDMALIENGSINKTITLAEQIANGVYLIRIKTSDESQVLRFTLDR